MTLSLGLDTGGTYTDAVLFDEDAGRVIAKAKALTTRHDLAVGIAEAADQVLAHAARENGDVGLVSISTTLATNALVEGQGGRAALVMIGFDDRDIDKGGLRAALGADPVVFVAGGHDVHGKPRPLELEAAKEELLTLSSEVSAFAVAGYFAVRNPDHEIAVRDFLASETRRAITCSHELTAKLDGPKRALTTLLNARLIDMITGLIDATRGFLDRSGIDAPLMVVRGDGSLVSADFARLRPIETILSGPAASLVGAAHLTGEANALVADIGGTTTDIAVLDAGRPRIDPDGATVGGYRTMVDAVAMRTFGLAGDSEVSIDEGALDPQIKLGPRRLVPISMLAARHEEIICTALETQLRASFANRLDGRFAMATGLEERFASGLTKSETDLLKRLTDVPQPFAAMLKSPAEVATLNRLASRGLARIGGFTPSDAQHVLGHFTHWNARAAILAAQVFGRKKDGYGKPIAATPEAIANRVVDQLVRDSADAVLETALSEDGLDGPRLARSVLARRAMDQTAGIAKIALSLDRPVIGLGAAAHAYYPHVSKRLGTASIVPDDADVANAIGAVVGQVRVSVSIEIGLSEDGFFELTGAHDIPDSQTRFSTENAALEAANQRAHALVSARAELAGAADPQIVSRQDIEAVTIEDQRRFVSARVIATASGRPAINR